MFQVFTVVITYSLKVKVESGAVNLINVSDLSNINS